uniref:Ras and EF-hand domain-containing protein homolog n=1 Tax=Schistocephalus solidus TaxID=70667 RepID=A0A0X3P3R2_SCHSO
MSTDTKGELAAFLKSYDSDGSGTFNRDRWLHLCSSSAINLPQNLATAVFDRLDTDHNGIVTINELLAELEEWQKTVEHAKDNGVGEMCKPLNPTEFTDPVPANSQGLINGTSRGPIRPQGTLTFKKREYSVYESSPEEINSAFRQSLYQAKKLGDFIRESYPELAQPFSNMLDSFKKDINIERSEHQTLEQVYEKEKEARKADLQRLERELDAQIQLVEERLRTDISRQLEAEYQEKIYKKEAEIQNIQEIVSDLKQKLKENDKKRSASVAHHHKLPQSPLTTDNAVFSAASSDTLAREEIDLRKALREAQIRLKASETELSQLQTKVETQSSELVMERMRSSNYAEEKDLLYDQVNKMKSLLLDAYGSSDPLLRQRGSNLGRQHSPDSVSENWTGDSGQWSGMNDVPFLDARDLMAKNSRGAKQESLISGWSNVDASQTPERIFRIILVGDSAVGKTSFMHRFCTGDFYQNTRSTIGVDFKARNIFIDGILCTIELWDTAGQERFHSLVSQYFRKCDGAILMYDVSNRNSFLGVRDWVSLLEEHSGDEMIPRVIVGNKSDLRDKTEEAMTSMAEYVTTEMGQNLAKLYHAEFVETSVLKNTHIEDAVVNLSRLMKIREDYTQNAIKLSKSKKKFQDCCH